MFKMFYYIIWTVKFLLIKSSLAFGIKSYYIDLTFQWNYERNYKSYQLINAFTMAAISFLVGVGKYLKNIYLKSFLLYLCTLVYILYSLFSQIAGTNKQAGGSAPFRELKQKPLFK